MSKFDKLVDNKVLQNLFVWFFVFLVLAASIQGTMNRAFSALVSIAILAPCIYIQNLIVLPFFRKNNIKFTTFTLFNAIIFALLITFLLNITVESTHNDWKVFFNFLGVILLALFLGSGLKIARDSFYKRQQIKEAELKLLKGQLNPHFLFNTLNNLYGLSVIKSDRLPGLMLKLSDLLRYSLYETKEIFVPLKKELEYLENYVSLERIRLEEQTEIILNISGNIDSKNIAPMLLIVFVENAFKHLGIQGEEQSKVMIEVSEKKEKLYFKCINTIDDTKPLEENLEKGRSGIGLVNVKKRLSLLYPNTHQLEINKEKNNFFVELILEI
ncbi:histidine kinase [uncultured Tenacibaculum sp.]|uniref:sensor histidine kinase n=1 Tax=uncultured Tenacibaculum sp. TaxID=174713 RepID=UPI0026206F6F|nr:histidine kinase [uncultured Tenacibaculum sp.]